MATYSGSHRAENFARLLLKTNNLKVFYGRSINHTPLIIWETCTGNSLCGVLVLNIFEKVTTIWGSILCCPDIYWWLCVPDCSNSIAYALQILQSCTSGSIVHCACVSIALCKTAISHCWRSGDTAISHCWRSGDTAISHCWRSGDTAV